MNQKSCSNTYYDCGSFRYFLVKCNVKVDSSTKIKQAEEQNKNVRPEIKNKISNFDNYDIIYVGD